MTSTVTQITRMTILLNAYEPLSASLGLIAIVLLIVLLIEKELIRSVGGPHSQAWMRALNIAIAPFVVAGGLIIILRVINLITPL
jgi:hypothetical protein